MTAHETTTGPQVGSGQLAHGAVAFRATGVTKSYPGVQALAGVDLEGYAGEVLAVCGANGAGKSTFARLLAGQETPTSGTITVTGHEGPISDPATAERAGVLLMHQEPLVVDDFTVGQNVWLFTLRGGRDVNPLGSPHASEDARTREVLAGVGLGDVAPSTTEEHFNDVKAMVEAERRAGTAVVFVSHRLPEVLSLSTRVAVLRNGELVEVLETAETDADEITTLMIGEALSAADRPGGVATRTGTPVVAVEHLSGGAARDVSLEVHEKEVLGLYGLVGSGRSSVARSITGQHRPASGRVLLDGEPVRFATPQAALRRRVAYLTEDRRLEGFVPDFDNGENLTLVVLPTQLASGGVVKEKKERSLVRDLIARYQVKGGPRTYTSTLSGGNQQKVCVGKWLQADPRFVVLDEPTKGIDVGARANIYQLIKDTAATGRAVLVVSSEAEELLALCHRILVMRDGEVAGEFDPATATTDDLIRTALGGPA